MLFRELLKQKLEQKREDFTNFADCWQQSLTIYLRKLKYLEASSLAELRNRFAVEDETGAFPGFELDSLKRFAVEFTETWQNHEESRQWASGILRNRTTFAVDGSQIPPSRDISMNVAVVQIGWFENPHNEAVKYEKDVDVFILSPNDLMPDPVESRVNERRIQEEVRKTKEFLQRKAGWRSRSERMPLAFYDNTLLVPFPLSADSQKLYLTQMIELINLSEVAEVPLVGYIAHSYSRDLLTLLDLLDEEKDSDPLFDADLLFPNVLKKWGDRSIFCVAKRKGLNDYFGNSVGFVYLQTTSDSSPARLELPSWICEKGLLDEVLDVVRAECIVGVGYPYVLETADQMAVISLQDREIFYRALQDFAKRETLFFNVSRKAASKSRRR